MAKGQKRKASDKANPTASKGGSNLSKFAPSKKGKLNKSSVTNRDGDKMASVATNVNKPTTAQTTEREAGKSSNFKGNKLKFKTTNNNATMSTKRTMQTRGVGKIDLIKLGLVHNSNKKKVSNTNTDIEPKVTSDFTHAIIPTESEEIATDGVMMSIHAEGSIDSDSGDSDEELDYEDETVGLIETQTPQQPAQMPESKEPESSTENEEELMKRYGNNPAFIKIVQNMVAESIQGNGREREQGMARKSRVNNPEVDEHNHINPSPVLNKIKSPSDTTIYAPGLNKQCQFANDTNNTNMIQRISNFVENVRLENATGETPRRQVIDTGVRQQLRMVEQTNPPPARN